MTWSGSDTRGWVAVLVLAVFSVACRILLLSGQCLMELSLVATHSPDISGAATSFSTGPLSLQMRLWRSDCLRSVRKMLWSRPAEMT